MVLLNVKISFLYNTSSFLCIMINIITTLLQYLKINTAILTCVSMFFRSNGKPKIHLMESTHSTRVYGQFKSHSIPEFFVNLTSDLQTDSNKEECKMIIIDKRH